MSLLNIWCGGKISGILSYRDTQQEHGLFYTELQLPLTYCSSMKTKAPPRQNLVRSHITA